MKIHVIAKTKARVGKVKKIDTTTFEVSVREAPLDGKANAAITAALAKYYSVPKSRIILGNGQTSRHKYFEIYL
jgi:uncharacterized protein YggU (UPF0235/DUF167 family)